MRVVLDISFDGRNINDIYNLPCVMAVTKDKNDKPEVLLKREFTNGRLTEKIAVDCVTFDKAVVGKVLTIKK